MADWWTRAVGILVAALLGGCGGQAESSRDGAPHWLALCTDDGECGTGLECLCGRCTIKCDRTKDCSADGAELACVPTSGCDSVASLCERPAPTDGGGAGAGSDDNSNTVCPRALEEYAVLGACDAVDLDCAGAAFYDDCGCGCRAASSEPRCGNAVIEGDEECDDGNGSNSDACTNDCALAACGDGYVQPDEVCDGGSDCGPNCNFGPAPGDGVVDPGEECDDGNTNDEDSCLPTAIWNVCGDGVPLLVITDPTSPNGIEECDDGNLDDADECKHDCTLAVCGDGYVGPGEECDDGNVLDTDECTQACALARCGDGFLGPEEQCDDGNVDALDGCSATCELEPDFQG